MANKEYQYMENPFAVTRRQFLTISGVCAAMAALPAAWTRALVAKRTEYLRLRTAGLYKDDTGAKIRVSHANSSVQAIYRDFAGKPVGEISEELFHTRYIDRSKGIA